VETLLAAWEADRPDDYRAATHRGLQKQMQMDMAGASESFRKAVTLGDPRGSTRLHLGRCLLERRLVADAISVLDEAVKLAPQDAQAWLLLADAQRQNGDDAAALNSAQECLRIDSGCYEVDVLLARTELSLGHPDSALVHVDRLLRDWPQDRDGLYCRMEILRALQRTDEAETAMSNWKLADELVLELEAQLRRLQTDPENDALRSSAAILMMQHFSRSSAVQLLETTLRARPDDQAARECLEDFHRRRDQRVASAAVATTALPSGGSR
jgi:predicted Zn-dependent protease